MTRRSRLLFRWLVLATLVVAAVAGKDLWLRRLFVARAQAWVGARVELGHLRTNFATGEVELSGLQLADPHAPQANLLQCAQAVLRLDRAQALRGRIVVDNGYLHKLQFGTPRATSGLLSFRELDSSKSARVLPAAFQQKLEQVAHQFLECVEIEHDTISPAESQLTAVAAEIRRSIPQNFVALLEQAQRISAAIAHLNVELQQSAENPLREPERLRSVTAEAAELEEAAAATRAAGEALRRDFAADLQRMERAREADLQASHCRVTAVNFQPKVLQQLLVSSAQLAQVTDALEWAAWIREAVPASPEDFAPRPLRGVDVQYQAAPPAQLAIRSLKFDGTAQIGGRSTSVQGALKNWTMPLFHEGQPLAIELQPSGATQPQIQAELTYRHGVRRDHLRIRHADVGVPGQTLGSAAALQIEVSPCRETCEVDLTVTGEQVQGTIRFRNTDAALRLSALHAQAGGGPLLDCLNDHLAQVQEFATILHVSGTLDQVQLRCESELADRVAAAAESARGVQIDIVRSSYPDQLEQRHAELVAELSAEFARQQAELMAAVQRDASRLYQLRQTAERTRSDDTIRR